MCHKIYLYLIDEKKERKKKKESKRERNKMALSAVCAAISNIDSNTSVGELSNLAEKCELFVENGVIDIIDAVERALSIAAPVNGKQCLMLWIFIDRLSKQHVLFLDALRSQILPLSLKYHPHSENFAEAYQEFLLLLDHSFSVLYGAPVVTLIRLQLTTNEDPEGDTTTKLHNVNDSIASSSLEVLPSSTFASASPDTQGSSPADLSSFSHALLTSSTSSHRQGVTDLRSSLKTIGGFVTKSNASTREVGKKHALQVKTVDSLMAMNVASGYAPARPVEIITPNFQPEPDVPRGFMKSLPSDHVENYQEARRKRLRDVMEKNKESFREREEQLLLQRVRQETHTGRGDRDVEQRNWESEEKKMKEKVATEGGEPAEGEKREGEVEGSRDFARLGSSFGATRSTTQQNTEFDDIQMPLEFPRDEFGVKVGNFPLGVRFLRNAIRACGGAVELEVVSHRISTLASKEAVTNFGNIREFLRIHSPTFRLQLEKGQWIVRLNEPGNHRSSKPQIDDDLPTWESMQCPHCSKLLKGRNFSRHQHCRACITAQIALGLQGDYMDRGPIAELAHCAKRIISLHQQEMQAKNSALPTETKRGEVEVQLDDGDIDMLAESLLAATKVHRFRLASSRQFAPILKAIGIVRDRWLSQKGVSEVDEAVISNDDFSVANLFSIVGESIHQLPIPWIEMGDIIDMCHRFSKRVLPPFNPPPRPADPRISLYNEYPGFLLCESEVDDEDDPSGEEDEFSDEDAPAFTFAPPVDVAEAIFTAGFPRDTKRLQHRMRTAPPLLLQKILSTDGNMTQREMYAASRNAFRSAAVPNTVRGTGGRR